MPPSLDRDSAANLRLAPRVQSYLDALVQLCTQRGRPVVSIILFGSAAKGDFSIAVSDVDAMIVVGDQATDYDRNQLRDEVWRLEISHGFRTPEAGSKNALEIFAERAGGNALSSFICTRSELLSGDVRGVFGLRAAEALLVDRIIFANIIASAVTVWGEDLLPHVALLPVRRLDVLKAFFAFSNMVLLSIAAFGMLPDSTKYAMGALKRSLHSCFFCYHLRGGTLEEEVAFFNRNGRRDRTLEELLALRKQQRRSFAFALRCLPTLVRLHLRTALDNKFPLSVVRAG
jgi:predicted nucleotidyltransferase